MEVLIEGVKYVRIDQEVAVNDYITVLEWISCHDRSYVADVLKVKAVDLPFVVVNRLNRHHDKEDVIKLDLRELLIKQLSTDFVISYLKK